MNKFAFEPDSGPATPVSLTPEAGQGTPTKWYLPRLKAAGVHLLLSFAVVFLAIMLVTQLWYPGALLFASGGVKLLALMVIVDLVLGPVLTFSVFDRRKKSLAFDLAIIAIVQLSALAYGLHAAHNGRPVFSVFVVDRIELVSAAEVDVEELKLAAPKFRDIAFTGPSLVAASVPGDLRERAELALSAAAGVDLKHFLRYYVDFESQRQAILAASKPLADLGKYNDPVRVQNAVASLGEHASSDSLRYLPVQGKREDLSMVIDSTNLRPVGLLRLRPWQD